jgi:YqaJ-like viral recombinase domain
VPELVCSADDPRWLEERRRGVTATEIVAIIGLAPEAWDENAYSLYHKKLGLIPDVHQDNNRLRLGRELEPIIARRLRETCDVGGTPAGLWRSTARPWQMATPDRVHWDSGDGKAGSEVPDAVIELKSWADADRCSWGLPGYDGKVGDDGEHLDPYPPGPITQIPAQVRAQVLWQMDTLDVARGHVGVLFLPSGEFRSYVIDHTGCGGPFKCDVHDDIDDMRIAGAEFWCRISEPDKYGPPSLDGTSATLAALRARFVPLKGKEAEIDAALWERWETSKRRIDHWEGVARLEEAEIREQLGEATILTVGGVKVATRVTGESPVKAHTRHNDYIRRTPRKGAEQ